jgi:large repetitive protein
MTRLFCSAFVAAAAAMVALAGPAAAQVTERDHRKTPPAGKPPASSRPSHTVVVRTRVDSYSPSSGRPGARVTIKGSGFTRTTMVMVGGRQARVMSWNSTEIAFAVPDGLDRDAAITLTRPGSSGDVEVGPLHLLVDPSIRRLWPTSGPPGTRVEIVGRGFERSDGLMMSGQPVTVTEWTPDRLVVTIPDGARTDYILLTRSTGERARSPQRFRVLASEPVIARFSPTGGPPGTRVRISGSGFTPRDRVLYGSIPMNVLGRGGGWVDVEVPRKAPAPYHFHVRGPGGVARATAPFDLDLPPVLSSFSPDRGAPGTQVDVYGKNFRQGDWISLAGQRLPIVRLEPKRISVTIPIGSRTGKIAVGRSGYETATAGRFEVIYPPTLSAFTPSRGEPGTRVTLTGSHLGGAEVFYGRQRIPVRSSQGEGSLVVEIPRAARDDRFRVRTRAGTAQSAQVFQVQYYSVIENARPRSGVPGATIVLSGRHLDKADDFYIGSVRLELVARDNNSATCKIPVGARSAPITWVSFGRRGETAWRFDVLTGPVISQFQPTYGPAGAEIIIRGEHIDRRTQAFFGRRALRVVRVREPHEIVVQLPRGAAGTDYLYLEGNGARVRSEQTFEVKVAPIVQSVQPSAARNGQQVQVRGRWFTEATEILIGKVRSRVVRRDLRGGSILIEVPRDVPPGPHVLSAKSEALVGEYRRPFRVLATASIERFEPDRARWGERVRIEGVSLGKPARIWFEDVELPVVKRSPGGKQIWVVIPDSARGSAYLEVEDRGGQRRRSAAQLTIEEPPPAQPGNIRVRDHRTQKPKKTPPK